ncbi:MAG: hypothetical protein NT138_06015 [Planctomycetales bacterium]|nr:hypothetical protein [Planctomycetales bacterium]
MEALVDLFFSLIDVLRSLLNVVVSLVRVVVPWLPLLGWIGFWTFAVNWAKAFPILRRGGLIGVFLMMFVSVLVWGSVAPPVGGEHFMFGLSVSNYVGKFIYVTMLTCIALLCGSAQLSGAFGKLCEFPEEPEDDHHGHGGHGHDEHGHGHDGHGGHDTHGHDSHGHDAHGHAAHAH